MTRRYAVVLALLAPSLAASASPARPSSGSSACRSALKAPGTHVVARGKDGAVFLRRGQDTYKGCVHGGRVHALKAICCENEAVHLKGRYAAYTYSGSAIGDETSKIGVYDLRTGKRKRFTKLHPNSEGGDPTEIETGSYISDFDVNARGSVVWLVDQVDSDLAPTGEYELRAADGSARTERIVDQGKIGPKSVRIDSTGKTVRYTKDGAAETAPIDR